MRDELKQKRRKKSVDKVKSAMDLQGLLIIFGVVCGIGYLIWALGEQQVMTAKLNAEKKSLELQLKKEEDNIKNLKQDIKNSNSLTYIEKQAREKLNMVKPDEQIYIDLNKQGDNFTTEKKQSEKKGE